jgi:hypothetical protein
MRRSTCRYCGQQLVWLRCTDGKMRAFDPEVHTEPCAPHLQWAWRKGAGMERRDLAEYPFPSRYAMQHGCAYGAALQLAELQSIGEVVGQ